MTSHQAQQNQEFEEQTDRETEDGQQAAAARCQAAGDGVAKDSSSLLFVRHSTDLPHNHGDNSNVGRQPHAEVLDSEQKQAAGKKPSLTANKPPTSTCCAIQGCTFGVTAMQADHKCHNKCHNKRGHVFHNMCAQMNNLCDNHNELDVMCCSMECKEVRSRFILSRSNFAPPPKLKHTLASLTDGRSIQSTQEQARSSKTSKNIEILAAEDHRGGIWVETLDPKPGTSADRPHTNMSFQSSLWMHVGVDLRRHQLSTLSF
jgi:hypothetical protein